MGESGIDWCYGVSGSGGLSDASLVERRTKYGTYVDLFGCPEHTSSQTRCQIEILGLGPRAECLLSI
jgi:hypothetical protein